MAEQISLLTDLPLDILVLVFPYLDARSFLSLCSTCKVLQQPSIRLDSAYWSHATRDTFRIPNQPVVQSDGLRWQKMYRRLLTQSRVFTWGQNTKHCLGHSYQRTRQTTVRPIRRGANPIHPSNDSFSFPTEMNHYRQLGIIADMQCGGWSTTLLTSKGSLYTAGILNELAIPRDAVFDRLENLKYPPGFPQSVDRYEPSVATRQFSSGRSHVLALSDSGRIWSWYSVHEPAVHVRFLHVDIHEPSSVSSGQPSITDASGHVGRVRQVVAGWAHSSAYISGTGIILWEPVRRQRSDRDSDMMLVTDSAVVPKTGYHRTRNLSRQSDEDKALGDEVGMVTNYVILEHFVVFVTDIGKVFSAKIGVESATSEIMELHRLRHDTKTASDVQGSFRQFAVFKNGEVVTGDQGYLDRCWDLRFENTDQADVPGLKLIPALQHNDVISIAFGDYHYHALHSNGRITSYGKDPNLCGALGLGAENTSQSMLRGIEITAGLRGEGELLPQAYTTGRQIWFEKEKRDWLRFMATGGKDPEEASERLLLSMRDHAIMGEVSEWFEQESRNWDKRPELKDADEDGLGVHFALSVSAAGWHSGALVLVNDTLAEKLHESCLQKNDEETLEESDDSVSEEIAESSSTPGESDVFLGPLTSASHWLDRIGRQFLGLPPRNSNGANPSSARHSMLASGGAKYKWADDSWPRLRMSDGREMPGEVPFSEWRFGKPDFKMDFEF